MRLIDLDELNKKIDEETYKAIQGQEWDMSMALFKVKLLVGDMQTIDLDDEIVDMYRAVTEKEEEPHAVS